mmetsp:Transcript_9072/g.19561  ORF Transcript_9072/g.19561 Transcript_9072/m.19561 type:complete len:1039 (-) Transcript_9072:1595-4711(-)|eukprot:CAMPEP_0168824958 /NCGR_PEP_ID=MMETSP0726-20121227/11375_1 /TAXON_ID=265536 /ORGANISM="Amphiprora sp., Strain CCMP467" /LENGTH=1038 /DNA_ID=CAMNT_0008878001 /DNA_START=58 /DNA_END=3174 /DNA_ORIENTATION=+
MANKPTQNKTVVWYGPRLGRALWLLSGMISSVCACFETTGDAMEYLASISDTDDATIELCQNQIFSIGIQSGEFDTDKLNLTQAVASFQGEPPLFARSRTHYKCGQTGGSGGNCILRSGDVQFWTVSTPKAVQDVLVEGITFESAHNVAILLEQEGDITFVDCSIQNHLDGASPVILAYSTLERRSLLSSAASLKIPTTNGIRRLPSNGSQLNVTFLDCTFVGNEMNKISEALTYGVVTAFTPFHVLRFDHCDFLDNRYKEEERGYLIRSFGSLVSLVESTFTGNLVSGWGLVEVFSWDLQQYPTVNGNTGSLAEYATSLCPFLAVSETIPERAKSVECLDFDGNVTSIDSGSPFSPPVYSPISTPAASPVSSPDSGYECYSSTQSILEFILESPANFPIEITLCPSTLYSIGRWDDVSGNWVDGDPPLLVRSNTKYKCGEDGSSANQCTLRGGSMQLWGPTMSNGKSSVVVNMEVHGITFEDCADAAIRLDTGGDVAFLDCIVQYHTNGIPVLSTYSELTRVRHLRSGQQSFTAFTQSEERRLFEPHNAEVGENLKLSFVDSKFIDNNVVAQDFASGLITLTTQNQHLAIVNCTFANNEVDEIERGYLIRSFGSALSVENSLFTSNKVSGWGQIELVSWDTNGIGTLRIKGNAGILSETGHCPFLAISETIPENGRDVDCIDFNGAQYPVGSPLYSPVASPAALYDCYSSTRDALDVLNQLPFNFPMIIRFCPNTVFLIGRQDINGEWVDGDPPLFARSRTTYICGKYGSSEDNCILQGGPNQFLGTGIANEVEVKGITFEGATDVAISLGAAGDISFDDCILQNHVEGLLVLSQYSIFQRGRDLQPNAVNEEQAQGRELSPPGFRLSFTRTAFVSNSPSPGAFASGLITLTTSFQELSIVRCSFEDNKIDDIERGYLIRSFGSPVSIKDSWFSNNDVSGWGLIELFSFDDLQDLSVVNNAVNPGFHGETGLCPFAAYSETIPERSSNVRCVQLDGQVFDPDQIPPYYSPATPIVSPFYSDQTSDEPSLGPSTQPSQ